MTWHHSSGTVRSGHQKLPNKPPIMAIAFSITILFGTRSTSFKWLSSIGGGTSTMVTAKPIKRMSPWAVGHFCEKDPKALGMHSDHISTMLQFMVTVHQWKTSSR